MAIPLFSPLWYDEWTPEPFTDDFHRRGATCIVQPGF